MVAYLDSWCLFFCNNTLKILGVSIILFFSKHVPYLMSVYKVRELRYAQLKKRSFTNVNSLFFNLRKPRSRTF
jgi:hypothetical protein